MHNNKKHVHCFYKKGNTHDFGNGFDDSLGGSKIHEIQLAPLLQLNIHVSGE